ncbi:LrgB family protein, partial [bacterium]|nr:LrgB family protein [bacterium]
MNLNIVAFWQTLSATPLLWMTITIAVFLFADWLFLRSHHFPLLNPVLVSILVLVLLLSLTGTAYSQYFQGARFIHFLLGPATVALAVPLYRYFTKLKRMFWPLLGGLIIGSSTAILSVCFLGRWLG